MSLQGHHYDGDYLGGHGMFPEKQGVTLSVHPTEVAVSGIQLHIPYKSIKSVKNVNESNMKALRVIVFGVVGALWKKKETYLCITYDDGFQEQNPIFKLNDLTNAQREIYQNVLNARGQTLNPPTNTAPEKSAELISSEDISRTCPTCGGQLKYYQQTNGWYCHQDKKYVDPICMRGTVRICPTCDEPLRYYQQTNGWYCNKDKKYV
jgi:hypothetical protein